MSDRPANAGMIQSDRTLMSILDALYEVESAGVTELSARLDVSKGTVHKHLKTLEAEGYVERVDGEFSLSLAFFRLGGQVRNRDRLCFMAKDRVEKVARETAEMTKFAIEHRGRGVWMYFYNDHYEMRRDMHVGERFELHQNAAGKAILAELADERVREIVDRFGLPAETERTITDRAALETELERIRDDGLAQSAGEFREGGISIAAPVRDPESGTVGAIALAGPSPNTSTEELVEAHGDLLLETARRLELQLRYV